MVTVSGADWATADAEWIANAPSEPIEKPWYRMPVGFGRTPGPRNLPLGKADFVAQMSGGSVRMTASTDQGLLEQMLPPGLRLRGGPDISVTLLMPRNVYWLAGLSYQVLIIGIPVTVDREDGPIDGNYYPVEWHNRPDNVMTAREELGWPALWADVEATPQGGDAYAAQANWNGFRFFEMELHDMGESEPMEPLLTVNSRGTVAVDDVQVTYKYMPNGYADGTDLGKLIVNPFAKYYKEAATVKGAEMARRPTSVATARRGNGTFRFNAARWEDMPTQYNVVNALAALPLTDFRDAHVTLS